MLFQELALSRFQSLISDINFLMIVNPLPHMPILGSSNSAANKDMMLKIWTNGNTITLLSRKHCGKEEIAHYE